MSLPKQLKLGVAVLVASTLTGCSLLLEPSWVPSKNMAYTADYKSTEVTQLEDSGVYDPLIPAQGGGRVRASNFYFKPGVDIVTTKVIALAVIPKGAVITGIQVTFARLNVASEMSIYPIATSDGTSYTAYFNVATATGSTVTSEYLPNQTVSLTNGDPSKLPLESAVIAVVASANWGATSGSVQGTVFWVID